MGPRFHLFLFCLHLASARRIVLTFESPALAALHYEWNHSVIKQYGRRQVVDLDYSPEHPALVSVEDDIRLAGSDVLFSERDVTLSGSEDDLPWNLKPPYGVDVRRYPANRRQVTVAVADSGVARQARKAFRWLLPGYDFVTAANFSRDGDARDADPTDPGPALNCSRTWHGTKVASVLAADPASGVQGVDQYAAVLPLRVLGPCGEGYGSDMADAIVWAAGGYVRGVPNNTRPAHIILITSNANVLCPSYLQSAIDQAWQLGALVVVSAGNDGADKLAAPANCQHVVAVGAARRDGKAARFSNAGTRFLMPGGDAVRALTVQGEKLEVAELAGTSFSAPHFAGFLSLVLGSTARNPSSDPVLFASEQYDEAYAVRSSAHRGANREARPLAGALLLLVAATRAMEL